MLIIPRYTFDERVCQTAATALFRGRRDADGTRVLAKVLLDESPSPRALARLRHEFALETDLDCDEIVRTLALVELGNSLVLVWRDPGGLPLRQVLDAGRLPLEQVLRCAATAVEALQRLHQHHIIHRDLCPENIFVDASARTVALAGLGIASRLSQESQPFSGLSAVEGSPAYLSPERTGRMNRRTDQRSDLYSIGVILYELLTGTPPFAATDAQELCYCHLAKAPVPPQEIAPAVPPILSAIVMRLLEKDAEDRYQSASGLAADLQECIRQLAAGGPLAAFRLGSKDHGGGLQLPQQLYGRDSELRELRAAWERTTSGGAELLLLSGHAGIGKSALVHELCKSLAGARGFFISGKFDQRNRSVPYAPIANAFRELCQQLLMEPEPVLARFRENLQAAVGKSGQLLTRVIPNLTLILGPQPAVTELDGSAARSRFVRVFQRFLKALTGDGRPLLLFLDDLQWVDLASLELLESLFKQGDVQHLLVIGAYRSHEVDAAHPLSLALRELGPKAKLRTIELGPLDRSAVGRFVADALHSRPEQSAPLAAVLFAKTLGNPFFLSQLLTALHRDLILRYDAAAEAYSWDLQQVRSAPATDHVIALLTARLHRLPSSTQRVLSLAACIGHRFDLQTLATITELSLTETAAALWDALAEGLLVPLSTEYRYVHSAARDSIPGVPIVYQFLHDRVQQAAYASVSEPERAALHLQIGRLLRSGGDVADGDRLFELVGHLNLGRTLIVDADEKQALAQLDLEAGQRAKAATAHEAAVQILAAGISMLGPAGFQTARALAFALHRELADCAVRARAQTQAAQAISTLIQHAETPLELLTAYDLRVVLDATLGRSGDAVQSGVAALRRAGLAVADSEAELRADYARTLDELQDHMRGRSIAELAALPRASSPETDAAMRLARHVALAAFGTAPALANFLTALAAKLSFRQGHCEQAASAYALLGAVLASTTDRFEEAYALVKLALALHEKGGTLHEACMLGFYFTTVSHYCLHWRELLPYLEGAYVAGLESGDLMFLSYTCSHRTIARLLLGDPLDQVRQDCQRMLELMDRYGLAAAMATQTIVKQTIACLELRTHSRQTLDSDGFNEAEFARTIEGAAMSFAVYFYYTAKGALLFLDEEPAAALAALSRPMAMPGIAFTPEARFFTALSILSLADTASAAEAVQRAPLLELCLAKLTTWARACPANYLHKHLLVQAEHARHNGNVLLAMDLYDRAIASAQEHDWPRDLALANELCAKFYLGLGRQRIARAYMTDASYSYARWGASAQLRRLQERYPTLIPLQAQTPAYPTPPVAGALATVDPEDLWRFVHGLQTLSREFFLDNIVDGVMRLVVRTAGAERGLLILDRAGSEATLQIYASFADAEVAVRAGSGILLEESTELALTMVRYVARTGDSVVVDDASADEHFAGDPYIVRAKPRSVACLSLSHQGRKKGVLYLENNVVSGAFTRQRIELLGLLSAQAAISIENAELYDRLRKASEALSGANAALEAEVAQRTRELRETNERLLIELSERQKSQAAQAELQAAVIGMQAERLVELSTPVVPIMPGILLMPLIGTMDRQRADQMLETALRSAVQARAQVVIVDITAATGGDDAIVQVLAKTAKALRLLGAEAIVTGIGAKMAQAMVAHGTALDQLNTSATLAGGMMTALDRIGDRGRRPPRSG